MNLTCKIFIYWLLLFLYYKLLDAGIETISPCALPVAMMRSDYMGEILLAVFCPIIFAVVFRFLFIGDNTFRPGHYVHSFLFTLFTLPVGAALGMILFFLHGESFLLRVICDTSFEDYFLSYLGGEPWPEFQPWVLSIFMSLGVVPFLILAFVIKPVRRFFVFSRLDGSRSPRSA